MNLLQFQLSKKFSKIFFGSTVMTKAFGSKVGKRDPKGFFKIFLIIDITKASGFRSNKNAKFSAFQKEVKFFHRFLFHF